MTRSKSKVLLSLVNACRREDGSFSPFCQYCLKDPVKFFTRKGLLDTYNQLTEGEKSIFTNKERFFNLLLELKIITESSNPSLYQLNSICEVCGERTEFVDISKGYKRTCSRECGSISRERTNLKKYGSKSFFSTKEFKEKREETCLERYGVKHSSSNLKVSSKISNSHNSRSRESIDISNSKRADTNLLRYGGLGPLSSKNCLEKYKNTSLERYGEDNYKKSTCKIVHREQLEDINFLIKNFTREDKSLEREKAMEYFNLSSKAYIQYIFTPLRELGYWSRKNYGSLENDFLKVIERELDRTLIKQYRIPSTNYFVDGYDPTTNTCYEFLGDYWHGNPEVLNLETINESCGVSFRELYDNTFKRLKKIKDLGYIVKYIWEKDFRENRDKSTLNISTL